MRYLIIAMVIILSGCSQRYLPTLTPIKNVTHYTDLNITYQVVGNMVTVSTLSFSSVIDLLTFYKLECKKKDKVMDVLNSQIDDYNELKGVMNGRFY